MELHPGTVVAERYEVLGPLGRGGMGELYTARNLRTERRVALKLLRADAKFRSDAIERFRREARAAGVISSEYVTQVFDVEDDPNWGIAIVFELLEGESLLERLRRTGPMSPATLHPVVTQILSGLAAAHAAGVIHRDLKPSNIFLERRADGTSRVKILDFGISKLPKGMTKNTLTEPGQSLGSFMFMPPEQIHGAGRVDARADLYAVGTLAFQALTGHLPFDSTNVVELVRLKSSTNPRSLAQVLGRPTSPALEAWLARALARDVNARFQSAEEAANAWTQLAPQPSNPPPMAAPEGPAPPAEPPPHSGPPPLPATSQPPSTHAAHAAHGAQAPRASTSASGLPSAPAWGSSPNGPPSPPTTLYTGGAVHPYNQTAYAPPANPSMGPPGSGLPQGGQGMGGGVPPTGGQAMGANAPAMGPGVTPPLGLSSAHGAYGSNASPPPFYPGQLPQGYAPTGSPSSPGFGPPGQPGPTGSPSSPGFGQGPTGSPSSPNFGQAGPTGSPSSPNFGPGSAPQNAGAPFGPGSNPPPYGNAGPPPFGNNPNAPGFGAGAGPSPAPFNAPPQYGVGASPPPFYGGPPPGTAGTTQPPLPSAPPGQAPYAMVPGIAPPTPSGPAGWPGGAYVAPYSAAAPPVRRAVASPPIWAYGLVAVLIVVAVLVLMAIVFFSW
ncbi:MAG TPA: protein kinase [Polyangiaceae bacterium]|nr:protein kinase [Polyangiaceae bacterium]